MTFLRLIENRLNNLMQALADPRSDQLYLFPSFKYLIVIMVVYLVTTQILKHFMANRKCFEIKLVLILFNLTNSVFNLTIFSQNLTGVYRQNYDWIGECINKSAVNADEMQILRSTHLFFISKFLELADTAFYIVRKNTKQLNALHYSHHISMLVLAWLALRFAPTGSMYFLIMMNSFVHFLLYLSFGLTLFGSQYTKYLWWKKHLAIILMFQMFSVIIYSILNLFSNCQIEIIFAHLTNIIFLIVYAFFHIKNICQNNLASSDGVMTYTLNAIRN